MSRPRVLLLGPRASAEATARALDAEGYGAAILPLVELCTLDPGPVPRFASWIASSAACAEHLDDALARRLQPKPWGAVGPRTAAALARRVGADPLIVSATMAELAEAIAGRHRDGGWPKGTVLDPGARERASDPGPSLRSAGLSYASIALYEALDVVEPALDELQPAHRSVDAVWISSARIARRAEAVLDLQGHTLVAISARAAGPLRHPSTIAPEPRFEGLVAALKSLGVAAGAQPTKGATVCLRGLRQAP